jgi:hypothetical protein
MNRGRTTTFTALTTLDPLRWVPAEDAGGPAGGGPDEVELHIACILAVPRDHGSVRTLSRPKVRASRLPRIHYGALGLVASAALAVIATLLWISPSAGEPIGRAGSTPAVIHLVVALGTVEAPASPR